MADKVYMTSDDSVRTVVYDLKIDGVGEDLSSAVVECHMKNVQSATVITSASVTVDADQVTYPGRVSTQFSSVELAVAGVYTLEWEVTIGLQVVTYPGRASDRPVLTVREEVA